MLAFLREAGQGDKPLDVRVLKTPTVGDLYEVIAGERIRRAGIELGLTEFVCNVRDFDDRRAHAFSRASTDASAPYTWLDRLKQFEFLASPEGGSLELRPIAEALKRSPRTAELLRTLHLHLTPEARAEATRILEGAPLPSDAAEAGGPAGSDDLDGLGWELTLRMASYLAGLEGAEKQVAALRLIERLHLADDGAKRAVAWVGAGKDPAQFGQAAAGVPASKEAKVPWPAKIPDGGLAAKVPSWVIVKAHGNEMGDVTLKGVPAPAVAAMVANALAALDDVNAKAGTGDPASPYHAMVPHLVESGAAAKRARDQAKAEEAQKKAEKAAKKKPDPGQRDLARLAAARQERVQIDQDVASKLRMMGVIGTPADKILRALGDGASAKVPPLLKSVQSLVETAHLPVVQQLLAMTSRHKKLVLEIQRLEKTLGPKAAAA